MPGGDGEDLYNYAACNYKTHDHFNPAVKFALEDFGYDPSNLAKKLEWGLSKQDLSRAFSGAVMLREKIDPVIASLMKFLSSRGHADRDLERIYWSSGAHYKRVPHPVKVKEVEPEPEVFVPTTNRKGPLKVIGWTPHSVLH